MDHSKGISYRPAGILRFLRFGLKKAMVLLSYIFQRDLSLSHRLLGPTQIRTRNDCSGS